MGAWNWDSFDKSYKALDSRPNKKELLINVKNKGGFLHCCIKGKSTSWIVDYQAKAASHQSRVQPGSQKDRFIQNDPTQIKWP
jgi:hypothetical protein